MRGLSAAQRGAWDERCTRALSDARRRWGDDWALFLEAIPPRGFLLAPTEDEPFWQIGCVAPSCDRAGRDFLLVLGVAEEEIRSGEAALVAARLAPCLHAAIGRGCDAEIVFRMMAQALERDPANDIEMMVGWRVDWIGTEVPLLGTERKG